CDYARSENGKLYIVGGGWDRIVPQQLPLDYEAYLAIKLTVPWQSLIDSPAIRVELLDKNGQVLGDPVFAIAMQVNPEQVHQPAGPEDPSGIEVTSVFLATAITLTLNERGRFILRLVVD